MCCILTSDPAKHAIPKMVEVAYSIGVGELGWQYGTGLKSHGTVTNWCTGRGWPVNCHSKHSRSCIFRWSFMGRDWVGVELLYNSVHRKFNQSWRNDAVEKTAPSRRGPRDPRLSSWRSDELEIRCGWENQHPAEWDPGPWLSSLGEWERNADGHKSGGSICCSSVRSPAPSHTQPFQIKWEAYFSKNCVPRLYCVYVFV